LRPNTDPAFHAVDGFISVNFSLSHHFKPVGSTQCYLVDSVSPATLQ